MFPQTPCCFCGVVVDDDDVRDAADHGVAPYCCLRAQENDEACDALERAEKPFSDDDDDDNEVTAW